MAQSSQAFPYSTFVGGYVNGLGLSRTSNTVLSVAPGNILDSTDTFQLTLGVAQAINSANTGLNGIDTGVFAASTVYAVYLVADPVTLMATGAMISASLSAPVLPFGYSAFALIGYAVTNASTQFLPGIWSAGDSARRTFMYDAAQATSVTAGAATSYTAINIQTLVPLVNNTPVWISTVFTPGAASRTLSMRPSAGTGAAVTITGQVTAVPVTSQSYLFSSTATTNQQISYIVSNAGDAAAINVAGFEFFI